MLAAAVTAGMLNFRRKCGERSGWIAQLVEQRTENPRVAGSIPAPATPLKMGDLMQQVQQIHLALTVE
jgi:hypothetical protein